MLLLGKYIANPSTYCVVNIHKRDGSASRSRSERHFSNEKLLTIALLAGMKLTMAFRESLFWATTTLSRTWPCHPTVSSFSPLPGTRLCDFGI